MNGINMKIVVSTIAAIVVVGTIGVSALLFSGTYDVAASAHHWPITHWVLEMARMRSIQVHAAGIVPPANLNDQTRIVAGTAHFDEDCTPCHAPPGGKRQDLAEGMYPEPPELKTAAAKFTPGELFWILKNGIKMSGMPSWGDHSDDELWNAVAFLENMPNMTPDRYAELSSAAKAAGGMKMQ